MTKFNYIRNLKVLPDPRVLTDGSGGGPETYSHTLEILRQKTKNNALVLFIVFIPCARAALVPFPENTVM